MKKWFEKWNYEKRRRRERGQPLVVQYRDENYVSAPPGTTLTDISGDTSHDCNNTSNVPVCDRCIYV